MAVAVIGIGGVLLYLVKMLLSIEDSLYLGTAVAFTGGGLLLLTSPLAALCLYASFQLGKAALKCRWL
jgi:hypothetical protein